MIVHPHAGSRARCGLHDIAISCCSIAPHRARLCRLARHSPLSHPGVWLPGAGGSAFPHGPGCVASCAQVGLACNPRPQALNFSNIALPFSPSSQQQRQSTQPSPQLSPNLLRARSYPLPPPSPTVPPSRRFVNPSPNPPTVHGYLYRFTRTPSFLNFTTRFDLFVFVNYKTSIKMSAPVDSVTAQMATTSLDNTAPTTESTGAPQTTSAEDEAVRASAAEGRRLYIGNLAYATNEGELKDFFKDYLVYVERRPT
jgi:hypothetical protein